MAALGNERVSSIRKVTRDKRPLQANVKVWKGAFAVCAADGFYQGGLTAAGLIAVGRFRETVDNTGGADGAKSAEIEFFRERTLFLMVNDDAGTPVTVADRENPCYVLDDQTVTADSTGRSVAGIVYDVTSEGVWVEVWP